ncbi:MAG TPA: CPBP family intramembrane glutamic endopeptidase [Terriglobales bacterium]|nr:CPBP family intramembrane glutamic endopeptidase [Terriglobales bacterium]
MAFESKTFITPTRPISSPELACCRASEFRNLLEVGVVFGLILVAVWTPQGHLNTAVSLAALFSTLVLTIASSYSVGELGLTRPLNGALVILLSGVLLLLTVVAIGVFARSLGPPQPVPWHRAWQYAIWALLQEFILQSFMYVRLESVFGSRQALFLASGLFALAHLPSPLLTLLSLLGAVFFCSMFRRYRNIFPLGLVHAALGLTIAGSLPDRLLHHMRVGIGYLMYHV